jgi:hypothetical protein
MKYVILAMFLQGLTSAAYAGDAFPKLTEYLTQEIAAAQGALVGETKPDMEGDELFLLRWFLRLQAPLGIKVPWVASFSVIPEVEFVWQRSYPQGWKDYKPGSAEVE